jgi:hypothetical protein
MESNSTSVKAMEVAETFSKDQKLLELKNKIKASTGKQGSINMRRKVDAHADDDGDDNHDDEKDATMPQKEAKSKESLLVDDDNLTESLADLAYKADRQDKASLLANKSVEYEKLRQELLRSRRAINVLTGHEAVKVRFSSSVNTKQFLSMSPRRIMCMKNS